MNKSLIKWLLLAVLGYVLLNVAIKVLYKDDPEAMQWQDREAFNRKYIAKLSLQQTPNKWQVIDELGSPDITEAKMLSETEYQVMFFRTQHVKSDGVTSQDECTALLFKNGTLIAWGDNAYAAYQELK